jgi:uncharacterized membrane protein (DUF485 family)
MSATDDHPASAATATDWRSIEQTKEYGELRGAQRRFLVPATAVYLIGYFGFVILAASRPGFFGTRLHGGLTAGLLLMFAVYVFVWLLVLAYNRVAHIRFDPLAQKVRELAGKESAE